MKEDSSKRIKHIFVISFTMYLIETISIIITFLSVLNSGLSEVFTIIPFIIPFSIPVLIFPLIFIIFENKTKVKNSYFFDIHSYIQIFLYVALPILFLIIIITSNHGFMVYISGFPFFYTLLLFIIMHFLVFEKIIKNYNDNIELKQKKFIFLLIITIIPFLSAFFLLFYIIYMFGYSVVNRKTVSKAQNASRQKIIRLFQYFLVFLAILYTTISVSFYLWLQETIYIIITFTIIFFIFILLFYLKFFHTKMLVANSNTELKIS